VKARRIPGLGTPKPNAKKEFNYEAYMEGCRLRVLFQAVIEKAMEARHIGRAELLRRLRGRRGYVDDVLDGTIAASVETYARFAWACGVRLDIQRFKGGRKR
jgi:hypothetical protein